MPLRWSVGFAEAGFAFAAAAFGRRRCFGRARFAEAGRVGFAFGRLFAGPGLPVFGSSSRSFIRLISARARCVGSLLAFGPLKRADAAASSRPASASYSRQVVRVTRVRPKWPYLSKPLSRRGGVVDQFGEAVPAAGLLQADEELRQFFGRHFAALRQLARLAHHRFGFGEDRARFFARLAEALQRHRRRFRERGQRAGRVGQRRGGDAEVFEQRRARVGEFLQVVHRLRGTRPGRWGTSAALLPVPAPCSELASAASPEWARKPTTCSFSRVSGSRISCESAASWASWSFCSVSSPKSWSTSRRVGLARLIAASRSSPRPARPAPSSLKISRKRCA